MKNDKVQFALKQVRQRFCHKLGDWLPILVEFYESVAEKDIEPKSLTPIIRAEVHKISGSAKTFGFSGLSEKAFTVEQLLDRVIDGEKIDLIYEQLVEQLDQFVIMITKIIEDYSEEEFDELDQKKVKTNIKTIITDQYNVLLVDDDELINDFFTYGLKEDNFNVIQCRNGQEALEFLSKVNNQFIKNPEICLPDLILLDVNMPGQSGFDILSSIK